MKDDLKLRRKEDVHRCRFCCCCWYKEKKNSSQDSIFEYASLNINSLEIRGTLKPVPVNCFWAGIELLSKRTYRTCTNVHPFPPPPSLHSKEVTRACMCACHVWFSVCVCVCMRMHACVWVSVCFECTRICVRVRARACVCACVHTCVCVYQSNPMQ